MPATMSDEERAHGLYIGPVEKNVLMARQVYDRMCSLAVECVLLPKNVLMARRVYDRMCSLAVECVLLL